jgi:hypothetical protein
MMIVSGAPSCGVTYNHHSDNSRCVIYAPRVVNYAPKNVNSTGVTHDDHHMMIKVFL